MGNLFRTEDARASGTRIGHVGNIHVWGGHVVYLLLDLITQRGELRATLAAYRQITWEILMALQRKIIDGMRCDMWSWTSK